MDIILPIDDVIVYNTSSILVILYIFRFLSTTEYYLNIIWQVE